MFSTQCDQFLDIFWLEISHREIINDDKPLRRERPALAYVMTHVNVYLARRHITDFELLTCIKEKTKKKSSSQGKEKHHRKCSYSSSCPTREGLLMKLFWQLVYETAWCIYVFIYLSFFNLLYTVSEKNVVLDFGGEIEGLALNVAKQTDWNDPKCQHAVTWMLPGRYRKMQFYIL